MAEITYDPTPADQGEFNESELEALQVGEEYAQAEGKMLAGKFEDAEALEKAYLELQTKLGEKQPETEEEEVDHEEFIDNTIFDDLFTEMESGEFTEETLAQLDELSSRELVEAYMDWYDGSSDVEDLTESEVQSIKQSVGGEQAYAELMEWSNQNLPEQYVEAFDDLVSTGNIAAIELAVSGLVANYQNSNGYEGRMVTGRDAVSTADVFRSQAEVVQAMNDPRYERDPAYRQDVFDKLERSPLNY